MQLGKSITAALFMLALLAVPATTSLAKEKDPGQGNPSQQCADNTFLVSFGDDVVFPLEIMSHGGCVSTVASIGNPVAPGDYSHAAFVAQCKLLEDVLPEWLWEEPVNFETIEIEGEMIQVNTGGFGGKIQTCTYLLQGYHSGTFTHN